MEVYFILTFLLLFVLFGVREYYHHKHLDALNERIARLEAYEADRLLEKHGRVVVLSYPET